MDTGLGNSKESLREAWDEMILVLEEARNAIDQPNMMPPPANDRNLAEGYRYLMGFMHAAVERAFHSDPARPQFRNALSVITRGTIDNAGASNILFEVARKTPVTGKVEPLLTACEKRPTTLFLKPARAA